MTNDGDWFSWLNRRADQLAILAAIIFHSWPATLLILAVLLVWHVADPLANPRPRSTRRAGEGR